MAILSMRSTFSKNGARAASTRRAAAIALCATACAVVAACSSGGNGGTSGAGTGGASGAKGASAASGTGTAANPAAAIRLAADQARNVTSLTGTLSVQAAGAQSEDVTGTMQMQLKPSLLLADNLNVVSGGQPTALSEVLSTTAVYIKAPGLTVQPGKPWVEIQFSQLSGSIGSSLSQLLQNLESGNPLTQTQALVASATARKVGTEVIGGVSTTHYTGTLAPSAAIADLPSGLRQELAPEMNQVHGDISWNIWIDSQNNVRKLVETENVSGSAVTVSLNVTSIDQPVTAALPPASQVSVLPGSVLGGATGSGL